MNRTTEKEKGKSFEKVAPKEVGVLDMVIAFDTTGSMAEYIGAVRKEVSDLIPRLFADNEDLRLGIVAFGDCQSRDKPEVRTGRTRKRLDKAQVPLYDRCNKIRKAAGGDPASKTTEKELQVWQK